MDYVRHELKSAFRPQLLENLTGFYQGHPRRAELMEALRREYPRAGWANDQDAAFRAALHRRFLELTRDLAPSDRGNLFEAFNRRVHLAADPTAVAVVPHPLLRQEVLAELGVELRSSRVPDALVVLDVTGETARVRIHDDKYYTGVLSEHAMQQIDDYARILKRKRNPGLIPYELTLPNGRRITAIDVTEVVISFPDAQALEPNLSFVERMVDEGVAFQVFDPLGHPHIIRSIGDLQSFQQLIGHQTTVIP